MKLRETISNQKNGRYNEFVDEENPSDPNNNQPRTDNDNYNRDKVKKKSRGKKLINKAKKIVIEPIQDSVLYQQAMIEIESQSKAQRVQTYMACSCCFFWMLNSTLGIYIITRFESLRTEHPEVFTYLAIFSVKWIGCCLITFVVMLISLATLKLCCGMTNAIQRSIGAFPLIYFILIIVSYMYSLYYGILILKELYLSDEQMMDEELRFYDDDESLMIKIFVLDEVIVGALIIIQIIYALCCGGLTKSPHLNEIEGESFGVDEDQVSEIKKELQLSRKEIEMIRLEQKVDANTSDLNLIKQDLRDRMRKDSTRFRSSSHDSSKIKLGSII